MIAEKAPPIITFPSGWTATARTLLLALVLVNVVSIVPSVLRRTKKLWLMAVSAPLGWNVEK